MSLGRTGREDAGQAASSPGAAHPCPAARHPAPVRSGRCFAKGHGSSTGCWDFTLP